LDFFTSKSAEKRRDGLNIIVESGRGGSGGSPTINGNNGIAIGPPGGAGGDGASPSSTNDSPKKTN